MKNIFLLLLIIALLSCTREEKIPEDILSKEKMVSVLIDIHILEKKLDYLHISRDSAQKLYTAYEFDILKQHQVDTNTYRRSFDFYSLEVRHMVDIYEAVVDSLIAEQKRNTEDTRKDVDGEPRMSSRQKKFEEERKKREAVEKLQKDQDNKEIEEEDEKKDDSE